MKSMRLKIFFLLMLVLTSQVRAEWKEIGGGKIVGGTKRTLYVDTSSIQSKGQTKTVWTLIDHSVIQREAGDAYFSAKGQWEIDCEKRIVRELFHSIYSGQMGGRRTVWSGPLNRDFQPVSPRSFVGEAILNEVCDRELAVQARR